jgi:hypothetical protein
MIIAVLALGGCGSAQTHTRASRSQSPPAARTPTARGRPARSARPAAPPAPKVPPGPPQVLPGAGASTPTGFVPAVRWAGRTIVSVARLADGAALLAFDQGAVTLHLHSGTIDAGATGWRWGPEVALSERSGLVAAFNGGFKLSTGAGGFFLDGRSGAPVQPGRGSIVTYADGRTDIGSWGTEVPAHGRPVVSIRQNLGLLIDHGSVAANAGCRECWGATLGGVLAPARSALGIRADGTLVWAGGEHLSPEALAADLVGAHVVRAVELDINPEWVAAYLYAHGLPAQTLSVVPIVPGQPGVPGQFLAPYGRDFFTVTLR